jgi:HK97 gp10 family phage protein
VALADDMVEDAKRRAPIATGALRDSIRAKKDAAAVSKVKSLLGTLENVGEMSVEAALREIDRIMHGGLEKELMTLSRSDVSRGRSRVVVVVVADAWYARFVELGTAHAAAHPFLRPAAMKTKRTLAREVKARLHKAAMTTRSA